VDDVLELFGEKAAPDDGGDVQITDLGDSEAFKGGVQSPQGHRDAPDIEPRAVNRPAVQACEAEPGERVPDSLSGLVLARPVGGVHELVQGLRQVAKRHAAILAMRPRREPVLSTVLDVPVRAPWWPD